MTRFHLAMAMPAERPIRDLLDATPEVTRAKITRMITTLIDMLDDLDGEADREEDDSSEPSLGWSTTMAFGNTEDLEEDAAFSPVCDRSARVGDNLSRAPVEGGSVRWRSSSVPPIIEIARGRPASRCIPSPPECSPRVTSSAGGGE